MKIKQRLAKKILIVIPVMILFFTLFFVDYTINFFTDTAYEFVYHTNIESVKRFTKELKELTSSGYTGDEYYELYTSMIHIYNRTLGEKESLITFLLDEDLNVYHSSSRNEDFLSEFLEDKSSVDLIVDAAATYGSGELTFDPNNIAETMYYQVLSSGKNYYYLFMGIDKEQVAANLNADKIVVPICIICLSFMVIIEYIIWLKNFFIPYHILEKKEE